VTNLAENQTYFLRVLAENAYGFSEPLELEQPIIPKRIFGKCDLLRRRGAVGGLGLFSCEWSVARWNVKLCSFELCSDVC